MKRPIVFVAFRNDEFELPIHYADSARELAEFLGLGKEYNISSKLVNSRDGYVKTKDRKYRYARMNPATGEIYVGKLPKAVTVFLTVEGQKKKRGGRSPRKVILCRNSKEAFFDSVRVAEKLTGVNRNLIYHAIKSGHYCSGYWRYAEK